MKATAGSIHGSKTGHKGRTIPVYGQPRHLHIRYDDREITARDSERMFVCQVCYFRPLNVPLYSLFYFRHRLPNALVELVSGLSKHVVRVFVLCVDAFYV